MELMRENWNTLGNRSAVLHEITVTEVRGNFDDFYLVSEARRSDGSVYERSTLRFAQEEFAAIVEEYQQHRPVVLSTGVTIAGPAFLVRWVNKWKGRKSCRALLVSNPP